VPAFTAGVDRDLRRARVVAPATPWQPDEIARIQAIIRSLIGSSGSDAAAELSIS